MRKILLTIFIVNLLVLSCFAQNGYIQKTGFVKTYQEKKEIGTKDIYINYQSISKKDTAETYTISDGKFTIVLSEKLFYNNKPTMIFVKPNPNNDFKDYEVVNSYEINNIYYDNSEIKVLIGDKKSISEQRKLFYEIITTPIEKQYQDKILKLQNRVRNLENQVGNYKDSVTYYQLLIKELEKELVNKTQRNKELSEQKDIAILELALLKENPLFLQSETYEKNYVRLMTAYNYFSKGQIDSARQCIPQNLEDISELNIRESNMLFSFYQLEAMLFETESKLDSAVVKYRKSLLHLRGNEQNLHFCKFSTLMSIAELEHILGQNDNAIIDLENAIKEQVNDIYKIKTYNLYAKILQVQNRKDFCEKYKVAIQLYEQIKKEFNNKSIPIADKEAALSYHKLANYYNNKKKYIIAEQNYLNAMDCQIKLRKNNEKDNFNYLNLLIDMLDYYSLVKNKPYAKSCIEKIHKLLSELKLSKEQKIELYTKINDINLSNNYYDKRFRQIQDSLKYYDYHYRNTIKYYANKDSVFYRQKIIHLYLKNALSEYYSYTKNDSLIISSSNLALWKINESFDSLSYKEEKIIVYTLLGIAYRHKKDKEKSKDYFNEAKNIVKSINNKDLNIFYKHIKREKWHSFWCDWGMVFAVPGFILLLEGGLLIGLLLL